MTAPDMVTELRRVSLERDWPLASLWTAMALLSGGDPQYGARDWDPYGPGGTRVGLLASPDDVLASVGVPPRPVISSREHRAPEGTQWSSMGMLAMTAAEQVRVSELIWDRWAPQAGYRQPGDYVLAALGVSPRATHALVLTERGSGALARLWPVQGESVSVSTIYQLCDDVQDMIARCILGSAYDGR